MASALSWIKQDDSLEGPARKFVASSGRKKRNRKSDVRSDADDGKIFFFETFTSINKLLNLHPQLKGDAVSKHKEPHEEGKFD